MIVASSAVQSGTQSPHLFPPLEFTEDSLKALVHVVKLEARYRDPTHTHATQNMKKKKQHQFSVSCNASNHLCRCP